MNKSLLFLSREARERPRHLVQLGLLSLFVALTACGGGGAPTESAPPSANAATDESQVNAADLSPTNAQSLPSPTLPDTPMLAHAPSAPISGQQSGELPSLTVNVLESARKVDPLPTPTLLHRKVVGGLIEPTDLVTASDGTLFFTERGRGLFVLRPGADAVSVFAEREVAPTSRSGMFAVALDPEFTRNRFVYVLARTPGRGAEVGRVIRVVLDATYTRATDRIDILTVPISAALDPGQQRLSVSKGDLRFGPDGYLYVSLGDKSQSTASHAMQTLAGKLLRIDRNGQPAANNKAPAGFDKRVYALGIRNPSAIFFHPDTEALLVGKRNPAAPDGSAVELLRSPVWGAWRNAFAVTFDQGHRIDFVKIDSTGRTVHAVTVVEKLGVGFNGIVERPEGLYVMTRGRVGGDEIWRLSPL